MVFFLILGNIHVNYTCRIINDWIFLTSFLNDRPDGEPKEVSYHIEHKGIKPNFIQ